MSLVAERRVRDAVDNVLRKIPDEDMPMLRAYVVREFPKIEKGNRMGLRSLAHVGKLAVVAMHVSNERFYSRVRWGDLMTLLHREIIEGEPRSFDMLPSLVRKES